MADLVVVSFCLATREGLVTNNRHGYKASVVLAVHFFRGMQTVLNFGPVLFSRSSKYCLWISSKLFSSSNCWYNHTGVGKTPKEIVRWMGDHAPVFAVNGNDVAVLHEPNQFFNTLKVRCLNNVIFRLLINLKFVSW